eukprot:1641739-Pyramimonas_sp.AAC.1
MNARVDMVRGTSHIFESHPPSTLGTVSSLREVNGEEVSGETSCPPERYVRGRARHQLLIRKSHGEV